MNTMLDLFDIKTRTRFQNTFFGFHYIYGTLQSTQLRNTVYWLYFACIPEVDIIYIDYTYEWLCAKTTPLFVSNKQNFKFQSLAKRLD